MSVFTTRHQRRQEGGGVGGWVGAKLCPCDVKGLDVGANLD